MSSKNSFAFRQPDDDSDLAAPGGRGIPGVSDTDQDSDNDAVQKMTPQEAGYLELPGAQKDAQCDIVDVPGGVSSQKGCCNSFRAQPDAQGFNCGSCTHLGTQEEEDSQQELPDDAQAPMSAGPATGQGGSNFS